MPKKYSHGLVFSHHYSNTINTHRPSLKPPSSRDSTSHTRSTPSSVPSSSNYSAQSSIYSHYLRLEPDPEPEPPHDYKTSSTHARHSSFESRPSDALQFTSKSSQRSHPPSDRLRLEDPFNYRIGNPVPIPSLPLQSSSVRGLQFPSLLVTPGHLCTTKAPPSKHRYLLPNPPPQLLTRENANVCSLQRHMSSILRPHSHTSVNMYFRWSLRKIPHPCPRNTANATRRRFRVPVCLLKHEIADKASSRRPRP